MQWLQWRALSPAANVSTFIAACALVWFAGERLTRNCRTLSDRTRIGQAFIGTLLLGFVVSLPEITLSAVAAAAGNAELAVNSLLGGISITMVMMAITDATVGEEPLSRDIRHPVVLLQGPVVILMLTVTAAGITAGDRFVPGVGLVGMWTTLIFGIYIVGLMLVKRIQQLHPWIAQQEPEGTSAGDDDHEKPDADAGRSLALVGWLTAASAAAVVIAGTVLAVSADALAEQTGLGASFVGLLFGGIATSLPELRTTISAVRLKRYEMAFSDAFGTNLCSIAVLFVADLLYAGPPILNEVGRFSSFAILLGTGVTAVYLTGLISRPSRSFLRMGADSVIVLFASVIGFVILYRLK